MAETEYWVCNMQGRRAEMEDRHIVKRCPISGWHVYAVCDGHGGKAVVNRFAQLLFKVTQKWMCDFPKDQVPVPGKMRSKIRDLILEADQLLEQKIRLPRDRDSGCTLAMALFHPVHRYLVFVTVGDSRCVFRNKYASLVTTRDHKPESKDEKKRIEAAGGTVVQKRVDGILAMSRAMGDFALKYNKPKKTKYHPLHGAVCAEPQIHIGTVSKVHGILLVACDGIFDVFSSKQAMDFVETKVSKQGYCHPGFVWSHDATSGSHKSSSSSSGTSGASSTHAFNPAEDLVLASYNKGSSDNMTAIVVYLPAM